MLEVSFRYFEVSSKLPIDSRLKWIPGPHALPGTDIPGGGATHSICVIKRPLLRIVQSVSTDVKMWFPLAIVSAITLRLHASMIKEITCYCPPRSSLSNHYRFYSSVHRCNNGCTALWLSIGARWACIPALLNADDVQPTIPTHSWNRCLIRRLSSIEMANSFDKFNYR